VTVFRKLIEFGTKFLDILDGTYVSPVSGYTNSNSICKSREPANVNEERGWANAQDIEHVAVNNKESTFEAIVGYDEIKREFVKALNASSPVGILLCGPPGSGKSEFLKQIRNHFEEESLFIDGSYGSKAGIFEKLYNLRPKYVLLDEIDKLANQDQLALLNLMESGKLTKTTRYEPYDIKLNAWIFASANKKEDVLEPLFDRFEIYFLREYTAEEFRAIAVSRLEQEGIQNEELAMYIADSVLRGLNRKSFRHAIRIARKCKTIQEVDETVHTLMRYGDLI